MKLSEVRDYWGSVKYETYFGSDEMKEVITAIKNEEGDFKVNDWRFIKSDEIDEIMKDELSSDPYMLGCSTNWFIAECTDLDLDVVHALQETESYEFLGERMLENIEEVVQSYISAYGYGHHFGHYDGNEYEVGDYYFFRVN